MFIFRLPPGRAEWGTVSPMSDVGGMETPTDCRQEPAPVLKAASLAKGFAGRKVLDGVSFAVGPGRIHGLLGPNGAGKSTTLRVLLGVVRPDAGHVELAGHALGPAVPRGRCGIAGFAETPTFYPYLTASRNLELLSAWDGPVAHRRVEELLDLVGLAGRAQVKVRGFSTGMRQRLGLAAALISDPQILIVDEPTAGLDPAGIRDLHSVLIQLAASGRTIVLSSHDLDEVAQLCRDVTVLRSGAVVYDGTLPVLLERAPNRSWRLDTSDNPAALTVSRHHPDVDVQPCVDGPGLVVRSDTAQLDRFLIALGASNIAARELQRQALSFESLYFQLTEEPDQLQPRLSAPVGTR